MYIEQRVYRLKVGSVPDYLDIYRRLGYQVQRRYLGEPVGFFVSESGDLNEVMHMWRYDSLDQRAALRERLFADAAWTEFLKASWPLVLTQRTTLHRTVDLSRGMPVEES